MFLVLNVLSFYFLSSAPALSVRNAARTSVSGSTDDVYSRNSWRSFATDEISRNTDLDDDSSLGVAAPFLKSFMQVLFPFLWCLYSWKLSCFGCIFFILVMQLFIETMSEILKGAG